MYWTAFGQKLRRVMGPERKALAFIQQVLDPTHAICARDNIGTLLGVVGFKTYHGALVGGSRRDLEQYYGRFGCIWRLALISLLERETENHRFLLDGIFVNDFAQGRGVGTALLHAIEAEARARNYTEIRLDVTDSNPRARALYEREGFVAGGVHRLGLLRYVFGFKSATTMVKRLV